MSDNSQIFFYKGNGAVIRLADNPVLTTVFDVFPITRSHVKPVLNHKHQWQTNCAFYVAEEDITEWIRTVSVCILALSMMSVFRTSLSKELNSTIHSDVVNAEIDTIFGTDLYKTNLSLTETRTVLIDSIRPALEDYLLKNHGNEESIVTNGVLELYLDNAETFDLQLDQAGKKGEEISLLKIKPLEQTKSGLDKYILAKTLDTGTGYKINLSNSTPHKEMMLRTISALLLDPLFNAKKEEFDPETEEYIFTFTTTKNFLDFYNSLMFEINFALDLGSIKSHISFYKAFQPNLEVIWDRLRSHIQEAIKPDPNDQRNFDEYISNRINTLRLIHEAAVSIKLELGKMPTLQTISDFETRSKKVVFSDKIIFNQIDLVA